MRAAAEAKAKAEAEAARIKAEAEARLRKEAEEKARLQAQIEAERKAREEAERKAKEEAERHAREAAERARKEAEEKAKREAEELRKRLEEERKAREAAERKAKEEAERREKEERERRQKEEERRQREERERKEAKEREEREREARERRAREESAAKEAAAKEAAAREAAAREAAAKQAEITSPGIPAISAAPPPAPAASDKFADSLLADLDSFGQKEEEEKKAREEAERKAKEEAARKARAEAEQREREAREREEQRKREEEERRRREEEERHAREEEERRAREAEEQRQREEAERQRRAKEALARKEAEKHAEEEDIEIGDDEADMEEVRRDERALSSDSRKAARESDVKRRKEETEAPSVPPEPVAARRPVKWGKPVALTIFVLLIAAVGGLHVMPVGTAEYERLATQAVGQPVKIGAARLSLVTGVQVIFDRVTVGESIRIGQARASPDVGSLFGERKSFQRVELLSAVVPQSAIGGALFGALDSGGLRVSRVVLKEAKFEGPLALPALDVDVAIGGDGAVQRLRIEGPSQLVATLTPSGGDFALEISCGSFAFPVAPDFGMSNFALKGTVTKRGIAISEFDGKAFEGTVAGSGRLSWDGPWKADGELRVRGVNVAVFAPALMSEGRVDGKGSFAMSGTDPAKLYQAARLEGSFTVQKGVLGSFDLSRAIQSGGSQTTGRTLFGELNGQGVYDRGAVALRNLTIAAGAMNAGASVDIDANGALGGRIIAEVKSSAQSLRATLNLAGTTKEPLVRK